MAVTPIQGRNLGIYVGTILIGCSTSISLETTAEELLSSCKATGPWKSREYGTLDWSASADGVIRIATDADATTNVTSENLRDLQIARTKVTIKFEVEGEGNPTRSGTAIITSVSESGDIDGDATFSVQFAGDGPLTKAINV